MNNSQLQKLAELELKHLANRKSRDSKESLSREESIKILMSAFSKGKNKPESKEEDSE